MSLHILSKTRHKRPIWLLRTMLLPPNDEFNVHHPMLLFKHIYSSLAVFFHFSR